MLTVCRRKLATRSGTLLLAAAENETFDVTVELSRELLVRRRASSADNEAAVLQFRGGADDRETMPAPPRCAASSATAPSRRIF